MILFPAIDLIGGKVVRLERGHPLPAHRISGRYSPEFSYRQP